MPLPALSLEVRSLIYTFLDDLDLAKEIPEVFWAMAPEHLRVLSIGQVEEMEALPIHTDLVRTYPRCGHFVEQLTLMSDTPSIKIITNFLLQFPIHRKLHHLCLSLSPEHSIVFSSRLPYVDLLEELIHSSPLLTRLSFHDINPCHQLCHAAQQITRLDLGHVYGYTEETVIPLPPLLEILTLTAASVLFLVGPRPCLKVLVITDDKEQSFFLDSEILSFIGGCPVLTRLAIVDSRASFIFQYYILTNAFFFRSDPLRSELVPLVNHLPPRIQDVCFYFSLPDANILQELSTILDPAKISFKTASFLLSMAVEMSPGRVSVEAKMRIFTRGYNLDACFVHCLGGDFGHCISGEKHEEVLGQWLCILKNLG